MTKLITVEEVKRDIHNAEWRIKDRTDRIAKAGEKIGSRAASGNIDVVITLSKEVVQLSKELAAAKKELTALKKALKEAKVNEAQSDDAMQPIREFLEGVYEKDLEWYAEIKAEFKARYNGVSTAAIKDGWSISSVDIAKLTKRGAEELFRRDLEQRLVKITADVRAAAGEEISEVNLRRNPNGGLDGTVKGNKGTIRFQTIIAGGYNIQRLHYRTLIK